MPAMVRIRETALDLTYGSDSCGEFQAMVGLSSNRVLLAITQETCSSAQQLSRGADQEGVTSDRNVALK
jgi:hypothetical protein